MNNSTEVTLGEAYDRGYDDGLKHGLEAARIERLKSEAVVRERDYLMKKLSEIAMFERVLNPKPIILQTEQR